MSESKAGIANGFWFGCGAVAATYAYFLLFAEFAFLERVRAVAGEAAVQPIMATLGTGGIVGSFAALRRFAPEKFVSRLRRSYAACALAAVLAALAPGQGTLLLAAAAIGLALGWNTVTLASGLRSLVPLARLGWCAGVGTGVAYALCNVPAVFTAAPALQAWICAGVAATASMALGAAKPVWPANAPAHHAVWRWVLIFLALVAFDSAAFYVIQHTPALREATWTGAGNLWGLALVHLIVAFGAGRLLDRGGLRVVVGLAAALLVTASLGLGAMRLPGLGLVYAAGVSFYSAALVYFAARDGRPQVAALVFALAGWVGSAVGIALAQGLSAGP